MKKFYLVGKIKRNYRTDEDELYIKFSRASALAAENACQPGDSVIPIDPTRPLWSRDEDSNWDHAYAPKG